MSILTPTYTDNPRKQLGNKLYMETADLSYADVMALVDASGSPIGSADAFGRLRVSQPYTLFDSKQLFDNQPLYWDDQEVSGSGTASVHSVAKAATDMTVSATTAGKRVRQTFQRFNYQPGKSQLVMLTGAVGAVGGGVGISAAMGYFDDDNGIFVASVAGAMYMVVRSSVTGSAVDNSIAQADFNGDKLDGTGPSGHTLDPTLTQIWWCDIEWLGVGSVRTGFVINGVFITCHTFHHANLLDQVYMSTPNLPIRYEIENGGAGVASSLKHICSTVLSEGGVQANGQLHWESTKGAHINANTANTLYAVVGIRLKAAYIGQQIDLTNVSIVNATSDNFEWVVYLNPTVDGTFTYADHTNSSVQTAIGTDTSTVTGGHEMAGGFAAATSGGGDLGAVLDNALRLGSAIDGTLDEIVLCVRPLSSNADIDGGLGWRELT